MATRRQALTARREALGFTQETLAQELGVEPSTVGRWERGTLTPQPGRRPDLAQVLRVSLDELDGLLNRSSPCSDTTGLGKQLAGRELVVDTVISPAPPARTKGHAGAPYDSAQLGTGALPLTVRDTSRLVAGVHRAYQAARYAEAARQLPSVTAAVNTLVSDEAARSSREVFGVQCSLHIAVAKLATKVGDATDAWAAAEQAQVAAETADDTFGQAAAAYQRTCALLRAGHSENAEQVAVSAADRVSGTNPQSLTWRGALTLISAIIAARRDDANEARRRLNHADELAGLLGADGNIGWTAFGPTNVLIHRLSVAVALGDPNAALTTAEQIDITQLPVGLSGRQAQFYLNSAWAHAQLGEAPEAVIHLLDTERVAPELLRANLNARQLIQELLVRERRHQVPGLRGLAHRAGVAT